MKARDKKRLSTDEFFQAIRQHEKNLTENEFTTKYLKTSRSYLCNRRNKHRDVSSDVLLNLYSELSGIGSTWESMATTENNPSTRQRWQRNAETYTQLANQVIGKILDRARADT